MIEITDPPVGEPLVRDLNHWGSPHSRFLSDLKQGVIHYTRSPLHAANSILNGSTNPEIISGLRCLTKAFQNNDSITPESEIVLSKVFQEFNPRGLEMSNPEAFRRLNEIVIKMVQNASDLDHAWAVLDHFDLRNKLMRVRGDINSPGSMAWYLNKKPLANFKIGSGHGKTAEELGIGRVSHSAGSQCAVDSITHSSNGFPNIFASRPGEEMGATGASGEAASLGEGFYTLTGDFGLYPNLPQVSFNVDGKAREGRDFVVGPHVVRLENGKLPPGSEVLWKTNRALPLTSENSGLSIVDYFKFLKDARYGDQAKIDRLNRKLRSIKAQVLTKNEESQILKIVNEMILQNGVIHSAQQSNVLKAWFRLPESANYPELAEQLFKRPHDRDFFIQSVLSQPPWRNRIDWMEILLKDPTQHGALLQIMSNFPPNEEWIDAAIKARSPGHLIAKLLEDPNWKFPEEMNKLLQLKNKWTDQHILKTLLKEQWKDHPEFVIKLIQNGNLDDQSIEMKSLLESWQDNPQLIDLCGGNLVTADSIRAGILYSHVNCSEQTVSVLDQIIP